MGIDINESDRRVWRDMEDNASVVFADLVKFHNLTANHGGLSADRAVKLEFSFS
jgi:class 3 adenylate cyclase